jgi:hydrogenase nickel incorporation protein HypB
VGEGLKAMILSVPEGDDRPFKYPLMFTESQVLIINKIDLLGMVDFDLEKVERSARALNPNVRIFRLSCRTGDGVDEWLRWLQAQVQQLEAHEYARQLERPR